MELKGWGGKKNLGEELGGQTVIRVLCMKPLFSVNKLKKLKQLKPQEKKKEEGKKKRRKRRKEEKKKGRKGIRKEDKGRKKKVSHLWVGKSQLQLITGYV